MFHEDFTSRSLNIIAVKMLFFLHNVIALENLLYVYFPQEKTLILTISNCKVENLDEKLYSFPFLYSRKAQCFVKKGSCSSGSAVFTLDTVLDMNVDSCAVRLTWASHYFSWARATQDPVASKCREVKQHTLNMPIYLY